MTEQSFQECRKVMQQANYWRGVITTCKNNIKKWTKLEDHHRRELRQGQADGCKKLIEKGMKRLEAAREKFASFTFPDNNLPPVQATVILCDLCGGKCNEGETYCEECKQGR